MGATQNIKPSFFGSSIEKNTYCEKTFALEAPKDPEKTLSTVMMTRLHDTRIQIQFNRLMLMSANDKVSSTYPLNRKITHVGRSRRNQVRINDPLVSVRHLTVSVSGSSCVVNDLDSSNGTFINGERLVGGRALQDGDEIMVGKTLLRFAARQTGASVKPSEKQKSPARIGASKKARLLSTAALCLLFSAAILLLSLQIASSPTPEKEPISQKQTPVSSQPASGTPATASMATPATGKKTHIPPQLQKRSEPSTHIQQALNDYAAGRLGSAMQTLKLLSAAREATPVSLQAHSILTLIKTVQALRTQAGQAQKGKKLAEALECWDRLLAVDMELVGERPSFFAAQAEKNVQALSYEHALDAYRIKNHQKVRQLCQVILQINPKHPEALALMAKIQPKA